MGHTEEGLWSEVFHICGAKYFIPFHCAPCSQDLRVPTDSLSLCLRNAQGSRVNASLEEARVSIKRVHYQQALQVRPARVDDARASISL